MRPWSQGPRGTCLTRLWQAAFLFFPHSWTSCDQGEGGVRGVGHLRGHPSTHHYASCLELRSQDYQKGLEIEGEGKKNSSGLRALAALAENLSLILSINTTVPSRQF